MAKQKAASGALWCPVTTSRYVSVMRALATNHRHADWSVEGTERLAADIDELATSERDPGTETITMDVARLSVLASYLRALRARETFSPHGLAAEVAGCVQDEADSVD